MNIIRTVRNNWKKSLFATAIGAWGLKYADQRWRDWNLMKMYCTEAKKYGDLMLKSTNRPKRVVVILNPAANKGKGRALYERNVAPILNLAGMEVALHVTQSEGQAKRIMMETVEKADAIIVAGGDGTLSEVVTGIMKRADEPTFSSIPICIVPLGQTNTLARTLYLPSVHNTVQFIAEMTLSSVSGGLKHVDALNVKGGDDKSVYAVSNVSLGLFSDSEIRKKRNWYFGPLKDRLCYVITAVRHWKNELKFSNIIFHYTVPCQGCNRCKELPKKIEYRWWNIFIRPQHKVLEKDYTDVVNEQCGVVKDTNVNFCHLDAFANRKANSLDVKLTSNDITKSDFIKKGWKRISKNPEDTNDTATISNNDDGNRNDIYLKKDGNDTDDDKDIHLNVASLTMNLPNDIADRKFIIDSEQFELMTPLTLQILPNKFKFYYARGNHVIAPESKIFKMPKFRNA
ncbi:hypothetical protein HELRODRAFT_193990 [Helobdella robusta]|uniref:DAGKc domain-containing protein n=1 Tax=Helobdella robusta TaxID=6412 RepID=T1FVJ8_HELRO|nr:hypothetical protein HELRODRAFT_193990 [Helobdella robusta]ESN93616.1 hypothetical protein HELRODRAFT_193990 [Helobdella robusta]